MTRWRKRYCRQGGLCKVCFRELGPGAAIYSRRWTWRLSYTALVCARCAPVAERLGYRRRRRWW